MKKIFTTLLCFVVMISVSNASFIYQEIDPICSISGTTHTSFPWEISDTSTWSIPKAYDGACDEPSDLTPDDKKRIYAIVIEYLDTRWYLVDKPNGYTLSDVGQEYIQNTFFEEVQAYIWENRDMKRNTAILHNAVKMIQYDYFIPWSESVDYFWLTESEAQALAEENDVRFRIGERDGEMYAVTMDYVIWRITATIENGIVVDYSIEQ